MSELIAKFNTNKNIELALCTLASELDFWKVERLQAHLWWRDDDAYRDSEKLRNLLREIQNIPLVLAVVPGLLQPSLSRLIADKENVSVVQHGWKHINHAPIGQLASEFPDIRSDIEVLYELRSGLKILSRVFPDTFIPVLVPPWHRCAARILNHAASIGFCAISSEAPIFPLLQRWRAREVNVEIDTSNWSMEGSFIGPVELSRKLVQSLKLRREWGAESQPIGILTHHTMLMYNDIHCLNEFIRLLCSYDVDWVEAKHLFAPLTE